MLGVDPFSSPGSTVVVWGNCQADPIAALLRGPLSQHGLAVATVPPVFLATEDELHQVYGLIADSAYLISQPIGEHYRIAGCGTEAMAEQLPPAGRLITYPSAFHVGAFPYQVNAHGGDGERVGAPLTDYHDLRAIVAAERGMSVSQALSWWPAPSADAVRVVATESFERLRRREAGLDVAVSHLLDDPHAMMTVDHLSNAVLAELAASLLRTMGIDEPVDVPDREFLGARRTPLEPAVLQAHGWPAEVASVCWRIDGRDVPPAETVTAHLDLYRDRPDVVVDSRTRYADRLQSLGL